MTVEEPTPTETTVDPTAAIAAELADYKDKYFRALAEMENSRKRLQREKIESQSYAIQNVLADLLQPFDHFEQALKHLDKASSEVRHWGQGFQMIHDQFLQVLADHGVSPFDSKGQQFDPHIHEAIESEPSSTVPEGTIIEEFVKGYKFGDRVIRPARVKVAVAPSTTTEGETP